MTSRDVRPGGPVPDGDVADLARGDLDVLVIGAGAAGLACAVTVAAAGRSVMVLEAGLRVGGRIRSHRSASGAMWELGAQVVHDRTNTAWRQFDPDADLQPFADSDFRTLLNGRSLPLFALAGVGLPPWMIVPTLAGATPAVTGSPLSWLADRSRLARRVGADWLGQEWGADPDAFDIPEMLEIAAAPGALGDEAVVRGGWQRLPERLARGLDVRLSCPVRRLGPGPGGVVAETDRGIVRAAAAVVAVPPWTVGPGALVLDGLPPEKRLAASALRGGDAVVAVVATTGRCPGTVSVFDAEGGWGFLRAQGGHGDVQIVAKGPGAARLRADLGPIASGVTTAVGASAGGALPPSTVAELSHRLAAAMPWSAGADILDVTVADWGADPYIGGAFTAPGPGRARHSAAWARPWGDRVFFAGESTCGSRGVGRVHGALASGRRAALELLAVAPRWRAATTQQGLTAPRWKTAALRPPA